jgi:hypothetical protein
MQQYSPARKQAHATMRLTRPTGQFPSPRTCQAPHADRACHRSRSARPPPPCPTAPPTGSRQRPQFLRRPYPRRPWAEAEAKQVFSSLSISPRLRASALRSAPATAAPPRRQAARKPLECRLQAHLFLPDDGLRLKASTAARSRLEAKPMTPSFFPVKRPPVPALSGYPPVQLLPPRALLVDFAAR